MNKQILVQVTQADIDEGDPRTTQECPVAKALMRVIADCLWVSVTWQNCIWKVKNGAVYRAELPQSAVPFINRFFCGEGQPFCFVIEPVVCPKKAYKGFFFDSNRTVKEVTCYLDDIPLPQCTNSLRWFKAKEPGDKQHGYVKERAQSTGGGTVSQ
jgi:hypothetical protein